MVRAAGAAEVHVRISSPPTTHSCFYGIDTPSRDHLLAATPGPPSQIREFIGADTIGYLTLEDLQAAMRRPGRPGLLLRLLHRGLPGDARGRAPVNRQGGRPMSGAAGPQGALQSVFEDGLRLPGRGPGHPGRAAALARRRQRGLLGAALLPEDPGGGGARACPIRRRPGAAQGPVRGPARPGPGSRRRPGPRAGRGPTGPGRRGPDSRPALRGRLA